MTKIRLDNFLVQKKMVASRSQANSFVRMKKVLLNGKIAAKSGILVEENDRIEILEPEQFVSRAALKLKSVADIFALDFRDKIVLDIGSSTGGFTEFALSRGAKKVIAVDVGTDQLHPKLRQNPKVELHEKTDIRDFKTAQKIDLVFADVSFISLKKILPPVLKNLHVAQAIFVVMVKPQFEAKKSQISRGVVKNNKMRREILAEFENFAEKFFLIMAKRDSAVAGEKGNVERFYQMKLMKSEKND